MSEMEFSKILQDRNQAMKDKNVLRKELLSTIIANAKNIAIESGTDRDNPNEDVVNRALLSEKKLLQKMIDEFPKETTDNKHIALLQSYNDKMKILNEYVPKTIDSPDEIRALVNESGIEVTKANMGKIMGVLKGKKCDMGVANKVVAAMIAENN